VSPECIYKRLNARGPKISQKADIRQLREVGEKAARIMFRRCNGVMSKDDDGSSECIDSERETYAS